MRTADPSPTAAVMLFTRRVRLFLLMKLCGTIFWMLLWMLYMKSPHVQHVGLDPPQDVNVTAPKGHFRDVYKGGFLQPTATLCPEHGQNVDLLILVTSHPRHDAHRMAIRHTWGRHDGRRRVVVGFMLGRRSEDPELSRLLTEESARHSDVIVINNIASHVNLTHNTAAMFEWVRTYCPLAGYVLETDDDVFVNEPRLLELSPDGRVQGRLDLRRDEPPLGGDQVDLGRVVYGRLWANIRPERFKPSKDYVAEHVYPAYVTTTPKLRRLTS